MDNGPAQNTQLASKISNMRNSAVSRLPVKDIIIYLFVITGIIYVVLL